MDPLKLLAKICVYKGVFFWTEGPCLSRASQRGVDLQEGQLVAPQACLVRGCVLGPLLDWGNAEGRVWVAGLQEEGAPLQTPSRGPAAAQPPPALRSSVSGRDVDQHFPLQIVS